VGAFTAALPVCSLFGTRAFALTSDVRLPYGRTGGERSRITAPGLRHRARDGDAAPEYDALFGSMQRARIVLLRPLLDKARTEEELVNQLADPNRFVFRTSILQLPKLGKSDSQI